MNISRARPAVLLLLGCLACNCQSASEAAERRPSLEGTAVTRKKAAPTPEIIEKAEEILRKNPEAALGSEYRFELGGKRYTARMEQHENVSGNPKRPPGKHKGVTVYEN